ncbi:ECF transporter S component [Fusibacter sp. 3D3]|uniref:ECF transporter S component n=1 Tax=Fusibacter sp. 3D3 TaxID=1048380 RepID=UPI0008536B3F|nr:ECF transporter S component [Fusibacter sp. 3D3]GAU75492.1 substrate-specific component RibU of riboflavin ECF transporter [Fusibacter sp. 3D3]
MTTTTAKRISVKMMTKIAMLSVISFILYFIEIQVPIFPGFLKIDLSDLPALIGAFALGPVAGIAIEAIKNTLHLLRTSTGGVGEIANFLIGIAMVIPAALIYKKAKSKAGAVIGLLVGTLAMAIMGAFANYFVLIPFYTNFMPIDAIVGMGTIINPNINSILTLVLYGIVPFNLFKGLVVSLVTMMLYKRISPILTR